MGHAMEDDNQFNVEESDIEECMPQNVPEMKDTALEVADMPEEDLLEEIEDRQIWNAYTG
jgi:hypothetical protein